MSRLDTGRVLGHNGSRFLSLLEGLNNGVNTIMKFIAITAGCAAALALAGCATNSNEADPTVPNVVTTTKQRQPITVTQFRSGDEYLGLTYAELNKKLGQPALVSETEAAEGVPARAAYSNIRRLDIVGEVFYTKHGSRTVTETHPPRFYETITVVRATFDEQGRVSEAVVSTVDRQRTTCQVCSARVPCPTHGCVADNCVCPAPCGCDDCFTKKDMCYKMGCVPGEACQCGCDGACGCAKE